MPFGRIGALRSPAPTTVRCRTWSSPTAVGSSAGSTTRPTSTGGSTCPRSTPRRRAASPPDRRPGRGHRRTVGGMELTAIEGRVLACLIEKEATVPDSYPLTLNSLRLACNQTSNRNPIVAYDDRAVEDTLLALKSKGLVRFVHAGAGARTTRYGHKADERWRLDPLEQAALAVLLLRGPQTTAEVRTRAERLCPGETGDVEAALDTLAARMPNPFAVRLARAPGERETRWAQVLAE